jgi:hypothetical protein
VMTLGFGCMLVFECVSLIHLWCIEMIGAEGCDCYFFYTILGPEALVFTPLYGISEPCALT